MNEFVNQPHTRLLDRGARAAYSDLAGKTRQIDAAIARVRLSGIDLAYEEFRAVERLQVLITEINAAALKLEAEVILADPRRADTLHVVMRLLDEERLRVRSAPLLDWSPNFSVFTSHEGQEALLVGAHWFQIPYPSRGPALAMLHQGRQVRRVRTQFQEMWESAHDIGPALRTVFRSAEPESRRASERSSGLPPLTGEP